MLGCQLKAHKSQFGETPGFQRCRIDHLRSYVRGVKLTRRESPTKLFKARSIVITTKQIVDDSLSRALFIYAI